MTRCPGCPEKNVSKPFPQPTGPKPCRVMLIGEGPYVDEYRRGRVFAGRTGDELDNQYLDMAGLKRDDVYVTNASKCAGRDKTNALDNPTDEQAYVCARHWLRDEIREVNPEIIVVMGAIACKAIIGDVDLEMQNGIPMVMPQDSLIDRDDIAVIPTWHPASGMHETRWMIALQDAFRRLKKIVRGDYSDLLYPYTDKNYLELQHAPGFVTDMLDSVDIIAADTEFHHGKAFCATISRAPGESWYIDANDKDTLEALSKYQGLWVLHGEVDLPILAQMGIHPRRWVNTLQIAYWLNEFRIGLKILAYRYLGMKMREFDEVAGPPSKQALYAYMASASDRMLEAVPKSRKPQSMTDKEKKIRKTQSNVKRLITDLEKDFTLIAAKPVKPWERIDKWDSEQIEIIEYFGSGIIPRTSIANVPHDEAVHYACDDSNATLQLYPILRRKALEIRRSMV